MHPPQAYICTMACTAGLHYRDYILDQARHILHWQEQISTHIHTYNVYCRDYREYILDQAHHIQHLQEQISTMQHAASDNSVQDKVWGSRAGHRAPLMHPRIGRRSVKSSPYICG